MTIVFYDTCNLNHHSILLSAIGASEYQFYNLVNEISKYNETICFNNFCTKDDKVEYKVIDNIRYKSIDDFINYNLNENDIIIIQRLYPQNIKIIEKIKNNKIFLWIHDNWSENNIINNKIEYNQYFHDKIINNKNINFVFVSHDCKKTFIDFNLLENLIVENNRLHVIYNILYEKQFIKIKKMNNIHLNKNYIVYASAWQKGINYITDLFEYINNKKLDFKLVLLTPGYDNEYTDIMIPKIIDKFKDNVIIHGAKSKEEYCKIIKSSLCVLSTAFKETFGCVFSESYYLGTPVIADYRSGAVKEIIDDFYIVDITNYEEVIKKLIFIRKNRHKLNIKLHNKFMLKDNLILWKKLL